MLVNKCVVIILSMHAMTSYLIQNKRETDYSVYQIEPKILRCHISISWLEATISRDHLEIFPPGGKCITDGGKLREQILRRQREEWG